MKNNSIPTNVSKRRLFCFFYPQVTIHISNYSDQKMATPVEFKTDWSKCCLCQQEKNEELKSPHSNPTQKETDGYSNIATNIPQFKAINALPLMLDPRRLDEGGGYRRHFKKK